MGEEPSTSPEDAAVASFDCDPRYQVAKLLGQGSYGVVCSAVDTRSGDMVAIKKMTNVFGHPLETKRTLRELRLLRHFIDHENVLTIRNVILPRKNGDRLDDIFVVTELMDTDLDQVIRSEQPLSMLHIQTFLYQILRGLQYIHASNVIHRDLKPGNILVNQNCTVKICDFGLARLEPETGYGGFMTEYVVTRWYRAPEIMLSGQDYTHSIDVWATGCILAEMVARRPLFPGKNYVDQVRVIVDVIGNPTEQGLKMIEDQEARDFVRTLPNKPALDFTQLALEQRDVMGCTEQEAQQVGEMLGAMLDFDPKNRCSVRQALEHPLLEQVRNHDTDVFRPAARFSFDFERPEMNRPETLTQLMLAEEAYYQQEEEREYGTQQQDTSWIDSDQYEESSSAWAQHEDQSQQDFLGEQPFDGAIDQALAQGEWGRDSLKMGEMGQPAEVPAQMDPKYNSMIAINHRLMIGEVDETQWGTKMLTPVCEERAQDLDRERKETQHLLAAERANTRAREHAAKQAQLQAAREAAEASNLPARRRVRDMAPESCEGPSKSRNSGSGSKSSSKSTTGAKSSTGRRATSAGKARPSSATVSKGSTIRDSTPPSQRPRSALSASSARNQRTKTGVSKRDKSFMPPIPQRTKRKDPLPAAAKAGGKSRTSGGSCKPRAGSAPRSRNTGASKGSKSSASSKVSASSGMDEKTRLHGLLNSLQQRAHEELNYSGYSMR